MSKRATFGGNTTGIARVVGEGTMGQWLIADLGMLAVRCQCARAGPHRLTLTRDAALWLLNMLLRISLKEFVRTYAR